MWRRCYQTIAQIKGSEREEESQAEKTVRKRSFQRETPVKEGLRSMTLGTYQLIMTKERTISGNAGSGSQVRLKGIKAKKMETGCCFPDCILSWWVKMAWL